MSIFKMINKISIKSMIKEDGLIEYFLNAISTDEPSKNIITELYDFLSQDLISNSDSAFWRDISELVSTLAELLAESGEYEVK